MACGVSRRCQQTMRLAPWSPPGCWQSRSATAIPTPPGTAGRECEESVLLAVPDAHADPEPITELEWHAKPEWNYDVHRIGNGQPIGRPPSTSRSVCPECVPGDEDDPLEPPRALTGMTVRSRGRVTVAAARGPVWQVQVHCGYITGIDRDARSMELALLGAACEAASCTSRSGTPASKRGRDERMPKRVGRDGLGDPGAAGGLADDPPGAVLVQPLPSRPGTPARPLRSPMARSIARAVRGASGMVTTLPP